MKESVGNKQVIGWREWMVLPDIGIEGIKAKVDTGARTSTLHAFFIEPFADGGVQKVRFKLHPLQRRDDVELTCVADVVDKRIVSDSGGHREMRYVIRTRVVIGDQEIDAEVTLTDRDSMMFRMLLGRTALAGRFTVDPDRSYVLSRRPGKLYKKKMKRRDR